MFGMAVLLGAIGLRQWPRFRLLAEPPAAGYESVRTQLLAENLVIHTHPFASDQSLLAVSKVAVIETRPGQFRTVGDTELLALAARPAMLVRLGTRLQILVFTDQPAPKSFPVN